MRAKALPLALVSLLTLSAVASAQADSISYTGVLASAEDTFTTSLTLTSTENLTLQTFSFGGGVNQAGKPIAAGGTNPFVGLFDAAGNFINGTSLDLGNYSSFMGCPPANSVSNFGGTTCGDVDLTFASLAAGTYTILLADGEYIPNAAVGVGTTLADGFFDLTGGVFCNLADFTDGVETDCANTSGAYALDVTTTAGTTTRTTPEPATSPLVGAGLLGLAVLLRRR